MPELPEVETIRRDLERVVVGRIIESVEVRVRKLFQGDKKSLIGKKLEKVERLGKMLTLYFSDKRAGEHTFQNQNNFFPAKKFSFTSPIDPDVPSGNQAQRSAGYSSRYIYQPDQDVVLIIHLKMTGQLIFVNKNQVKSEKLKVKNDDEVIIGGHPDKLYSTLPPHKHTHIIITFTDGAALYYNDLRKFGWMKLIKFQITNNKYQTNSSSPAGGQILKLRLGIDGLSKALTLDYLQKIAKNRKITIKQLLMDQNQIAGIGNIYGDEILYCARVLPTNKASDLSSGQINNIVKCIPRVLTKSIEVGGTSSSDYRKIDGSKGGYLDVAWVYGREGLPCRVCRKPIKRIKIGQRSSHYCPKCQK